MIRKFAGLARVLAVAAFASTTVACGTLELPLILEVEEGTFLSLEVPNGSGNVQTTDLSGGVETTLTTEISLIDLLLVRPIVGILTADDALLAGTPISILGLNTNEVCVIPGEDGGGGGTVVIDRIFNTLTVDVTLDSRVIAGNQTLRDLNPGGLPFPVEVSDTVTHFTTIDLIALIGGTGDLTISQEIMDEIVLNVLGTDLPIGVTGQLTLSNTEEFPTDPLLDDCITLLMSLGYL